MEAEVPSTELLARWTSAFFMVCLLQFQACSFCVNSLRYGLFGGSHHDLLVELGSNIRQIEDNSDDVLWADGPNIQGDLLIITPPLSLSAETRKHNLC
jgi:hypothetical protein